MIHLSQHTILNMRTMIEIEPLFNPKAPECSWSFFTGAIFFYKSYVLWILARPTKIGVKWCYFFYAFISSFTKTIILVQSQCKTSWYTLKHNFCQFYHLSSVMAREASFFDPLWWYRCRKISAKDCKHAVSAVLKYYKDVYT